VGGFGGKNCRDELVYETLTGVIGIVGFTIAGMLPWWMILVVILAGVLGTLAFFKDYIPGMGGSGGGDGG